MAELSLRNNQPAEAVKFAQEALSNGDNSAQTVGLLGEALLLANKPREAVAAFTQALSLEPQRAAFLLGRATAYAQINDETKAIQDLTAALPLENNATTRLRLARLYANSKAYAEATTLYQQVLKDEPDNQEAQTALAVLLVESGQSAEAIAALENLLKTSPDRADIRAQLAALYLPTAPDKALIQYLAANKLKPEVLSYAVGAGSAMVKLKRFSEAAALLRRVLEQNPTGETAYVTHTNLATALFELDDFVNAAREFVWILNQQRDRQRAAVTLYFLGICFDKLGDLEQAQKVYKQFLTVAGPENQLEIEKVNLRLPPLKRQLEKGQGKKKP
ncbi:MAG: tetratricopeptide repeat protein [Acidobacteria bacterium]|nr:tetratricopeptide repeat protein [Acidobacteriota bacterium]